MFLTFFAELKAAGIPVSLKEYLTLMEALDKGLAQHSTEEFYFLSRAALVKDERNLDKFDRVFGHVFKGLASPAIYCLRRFRRNGCGSSPKST
jgi:uncharacterized protein